MQRSVKFAKYLPDFGWMPTVWATEHIGDLPHDSTLLDGLPETVEIHRWRPRYGGCTRRRVQYGHNANQGFSSRLVDAFDRRLRNTRRSSSLPDDHASWARASVDPLCRLIEKKRIDVIYSTFSPASNHLLGLTLRRKTGLPWVADFRDLWTDDYRYHEESGKRRQAHHDLEKEILETADAVIGVTERQTAILAAHVPSQQDKFSTITNGYDPNDFAVKHTPLKKETFVLAHVGRFDRWRTSEALFEGLARFVKGLGAQRDRFILRAVGHVGGHLHDDAHATQARCEFTGYASHSRAVGEMCSADALLLGVPDGPNADSVIPAKLFEYLASGRPILVVGPEGGECERIVRDTGAGLAVTFEPDTIAEALGTMFLVWQSGKEMAGCPHDRLAPFNRVDLTGRLASVFDELSVAHATVGRPWHGHMEVCAP